MAIIYNPNRHRPRNGAAVYATRHTLAAGDTGQVPEVAVRIRIVAPDNACSADIRAALLEAADKVLHDPDVARKLAGRS